MYQPQQREILCNFLTGAGWIQGKIVLHHSHKLLEALENLRTPYIKLRDVVLPTGTVPFFVLSRDAVSLIVPAPDSEGLQGSLTEGPISHRIACLMSAGVLDGNIDMKKGVRVSDHIEKAGSFLYLELCVLHVGGTQSALDKVIVNTKHIVGVADSADVQ